MATDLKETLQGLRLDREEEEQARGRRRRFGRIVALVVVLAGGLGVVFSGRPAAVEVAAPEMVMAEGGLVTVLNASGYVVARRQATVSSKVTGKIVEVLFDEGMKVEAGQVLARLDDAESSRALALLAAELEAAKKGVNETEVRLAQARLDLGRSERLVREQVQSEANFDAAKAEVDALGARLAVSRQQVAVAERAVEVARQDLDNMVVRAPFTGVAISKDAQPGEMISPVSAGGGFTRTGVSTVVDMSSLEIEVDVNESYIDRVRAGQPVEARLNAYRDWQIPCAVITTVPAADRERATVRVRIGFGKEVELPADPAASGSDAGSVSGPRRLDPRILPEMGVKVAFLADPAEAGEAGQRLALPATAVRRDGEDEVVFVVLEGKAVRRKVVVEKRDETTKRVVLSAGVAAGEQVVVSGPERLKDGQRVRVHQGAEK